MNFTTLSQMDNNILLGIVSLILIVNGGAYGIMWKAFNRMKEKVQFKDNCYEIVKRQDERHKEIKEDLKEIKQLIRVRNGEQ